MDIKQLVVIGAGLVTAMTSVASAAPGWCGGAKFDSYDLGSLSGQDPRDVVVTLAKATCSPTAEAKASAANIEGARQAWGKKLGMVDADWADAVAYATDSANNEPRRWDFTTKSFAQMTAIDQYRMLRDGIAGPNGSGPLADDTYLADALEPTLTEAGRLGLIEKCAQNHNATGNSAPAWAICQTDIKRWDPAKFATQLRADTAHTPVARMTMRFKGYAIAAQLKEHAADVAKLLKEDPIYQKMFDLAEQARTEWTSGIGTNKELLAFVTAMDSAVVFQSRSAFDGCAAKADAALKDAAAKLPAKSFAKMMDVKDDPVNGFGAGAGPVLANDPLVHLAAEAYIMCQPAAAMSEFLMTAIETRPGARGPRVAAISKIEGAKLQPDDMNAHVDYPKFSNRPYSYSHGATMTWGGVIKSLKPGPDGTVITFEKETIKQQNCVTEHQSNHIDHIENNGTVRYQLDCDKWEWQTIDRTPDPKTIEAMFAKVLKPGERVSVVFNGSDDLEGLAERRGGAKGDRNKKKGAVIATWANKGAALPNSVLGASIK